MGADSATRVLQASQRRKERQQVAAVCYRIRKLGVEFLLVQSRGGRWIFPKGGAEPGLTHAQSAALEAFEEAGVHGRMEVAPFARYFHRKGSSEPTEPAVSVHLCEVSRVETPQESKRKPTWFPVEKAKQCLREDREPAFGAELASVVDRALSRIQRLHANLRGGTDHLPKDGLQKVRFEAPEEDRMPSSAARARDFPRQRRAARPVTAIDVTVAALQRIFRIGEAAEVRRPILRLGFGEDTVDETSRNITVIDTHRKANLPKAGDVASGKHKSAGKLVR